MADQSLAINDEIRHVLDRDVRPYLQSHGGDIEVVSITPSDEGVAVVLDFRAACRCCELKTVTFAATARSVLKRLPNVNSVNCVGISLSERRLDEIAEFFADGR